MTTATLVGRRRESRFFTITTILPNPNPTIYSRRDGDRNGSSDSLCSGTTSSPKWLTVDSCSYKVMLVTTFRKVEVPAYFAEEVR